MIEHPIRRREAPKNACIQDGTLVGLPVQFVAAHHLTVEATMLPVLHFVEPERQDVLCQHIQNLLLQCLNRLLHICIEIPGGNILLHVLFMASIMYSNDVTINRIGIIPMACMCHMPFLPPFNGRFPSQSRLFNAVDGINSPINITQHISIGICVGVFQTHISIKRPYLSDGQGFDDITIPHSSLRIKN